MSRRPRLSTTTGDPEDTSDVVRLPIGINIRNEMLAELIARSLRTTRTAGLKANAHRHLLHSRFSAFFRGGTFVFFEVRPTPPKVHGRPRTGRRGSGSGR